MGEPFLDKETLAEMAAIEEGANTARLDIFSLEETPDMVGGRRRSPVRTAGDVACRLGMVTPLEGDRREQTSPANQYRVTVARGTEIPLVAYVHVHAIDDEPADLWLRVIATDVGRSYATRLRLVCERQDPPHVEEAAPA